jgi:hypothetical protein
MLLSTNALQYPEYPVLIVDSSWPYTVSHPFAEVHP